MGTPSRDTDGRGEGPSTSTPSRISLAALCTPTGSPLPPPNDSVEGISNSSLEAASDHDVSMTDANDERVLPDPTLDETDREAASNDTVDTPPATTADENRKAKINQAGAKAKEFSQEGVDVEGEEDDEDEDEDDEEDDEDEDEDEDDEASGSESGSFRSTSEMEGVEGDSSAKMNGSLGLGPSDSILAFSDKAVAGPSSLQSQQDGTSSAAAEIGRVDPPKKKRQKRRSPSLDVALPIGPPPRPTVRLQLTIAHDDEEEYLTNVPEQIYHLLKDKQKPWAEWYESNLPEAEASGTAGADAAEGPDLSELGGLAKLLQKYPDKAPGRVNKKRKIDLYDIGQYDTKDPFVDDSELGVDEPTHSAKPSADGFFVTQGEVELQKQIAAAKDVQAGLQSTAALLGKKTSVPAGFGQSVNGGGGAGATFLRLGPGADSIAVVNALLSDHSVELDLISPAAKDDDEPKQSYFDLDSRRKASTPEPPLSQGDVSVSGTFEGSRTSPIKVDEDDHDSARSRPAMPAPLVKYPTRPVPNRLGREFDMLLQKVSRESWLKKQKFPPDLREPLMQATKVAVALNEYNENFFNCLPHIFPYNRLTLHKYTKRQFVALHTSYMRRLQEKNLEVLNAQIKEALPILRHDYEEALQKWNGSGDQSNTQQQQNGSQDHGPDDDAHEEQAAEEAEGEEAEKADDEANTKGEPVKRWRWSESMREILFTIVTIDSAIVDLKNEKLALEGSAEKTSVTNARKAVYKRAYDLWPEDGWTTTTNISREYALYKRKVDRYTQQYHDALGKDVSSAIAI